MARGHRLATRCDTELWVHLYEDLGEGFFEKARGQFAVALWDRNNRTLDPRPRPGGDLPALLHRGRRLAALGLGDQGAALLGTGRRAARPEGHRPVLQHVLRRHDADVLRGDQVDPARAITCGFATAGSSSRNTGTSTFPTPGQERRLDDPTPLVDELEFLMRQAVERRLRGDVPVVSYISGGLDSTVVLGLSSRQRGYAVPSFTIGLDRAGPDERSHARESAAALGSPLDDRDDEPRRHRGRLSRADPRGRGAGDGLVGRLPDAAGARRARAGLQGRADRRGGRRGPGRLCLVQDPEDPRRRSAGARWSPPSKARAKPGSGVDRRRRPTGPTCSGFAASARPSRTSTTSWARPGRVLYSARLWDRLAGHSAYDDLDLTNDRFSRWHPLNQSLYVGYKVMLAGLLLLAKGDRVAMNSSVEARYPLLDDDVIAFCASIAPEYKLRGLTDKWLLRQVAARTLPAADRQPAQDDVPRQPVRGVPRPDRPRWVDQLLSPESLKATGWFDPEGVARERAAQVRFPRITPKRIIMDLSLTCVIATQLWHHIYLGGGLCELPTWDAMSPQRSEPSGLGLTLPHHASSWTAPAAAG